MYNKWYQVDNYYLTIMLNDFGRCLSCKTWNKFTSEGPFSYTYKYCKGVVKKPEINFIQGPYNKSKAIQFVFNIYIRVIFWFATVIFKILFKNF